MPTCPICGDHKEKIFQAKVALAFEDNFDLIACRNCGTAFFSPLPSVTQLLKFYNNSYYNFDKYRDEFKGKVYGRKLSKKSEKGNFLDVGCSTGHFLKGVRDNSSWKVYGTEFSNPAVKYAKEKLGLDVRLGELHEGEFEKEFFDYIHVNNVMEHVLDPDGFLREVNRILKPGGVFQMMIPNGPVDSLPLKKYYQEESKPAKSKDGHIYFFPAAALIELLAKRGLVVVRAKTGSIGRGLKTLGILPQKSGWKEMYTSHPEPAENAIFEPREVKKRSETYYAYRYFMNNAKDIPGMWPFGQDYLLIAKKAINR